ncbi:hypothetical protein D3C81_1650160 [compost metagenome]
MSTISGRPWAWAASARAAKSTTLPSGLPMDSQKTALVRSSVLTATASMSSASMKRTSMPYWGRVWANRL